MSQEAPVRRLRSFRSRPIRHKLAVVVLLPLIGVVAMSALQIESAFSRAGAADKTMAFVRFDAKANALVAALQAERLGSTKYVGTSYREGGSELSPLRRATDAARRDLIADVRTLPGGDARLRSAIGVAVRSLGEIDSSRRQMDGHALTPQQVPDGPYTTVVADLLDIVSTEVGVGTSDSSVVRIELALSSLSHAKEGACQERGLSAVLFLGRTQPVVLQRIRQGSDTETAWLVQFRNTADPALRQLYQRVVGPTDPPVAAMRTQAFAELDAHRRPDVNPLTWLGTSNVKIEAYSKVEAAAVAALQHRASVLGHDSRRTAWLLLGLAVAVAIIALALALQIALGMAREVGQVQSAVLDAADRRLPDVMGRLARGQPVPADSESPRLPALGTREITALGQAALSLYEAAVTSGREALAVRSVGAQTVSIGARVRTLVSRQHGLLTGLEHSETDPEKLQRLFELDSLAAQMRRFVEGLFVLADERPMRAAGRPADLLDVVRGAQAEVQGYERVAIQLGAYETRQVKASVVGDLTHLLAELIANATSASPPGTPVQVMARRAVRGCALVVQDRGTGLPAERIGELNDRLANPPELDLTGAEHLGLAVVAKLARRHDARVRLEESAYGGISAIVLLPWKAFEDDLSGNLEGAVEIGAYPSGEPEPETAGLARRVPRREGIPTLPTAMPAGGSGRRGDGAPRRRERGAAATEWPERAGISAGRAAPPLERRQRGRHLAPSLAFPAASTGPQRPVPAVPSPPSAGPGQPPEDAGAFLRAFQTNFAAGAGADDVREGT